jgi:PAS domain S-box-containing protein
MALEQANRQLKRALEEREIFAALIENSSDFIGMADPEGRPVYANPAARRLIGLDPQFPVESTQILDYYPPGLRWFAKNVILKGMQETGRWQGETFFRHWKTGEAIPVSDTHFMIRDPATGRILGSGTISRDISEIKRARDELELANRELARAHRKQRFLAEAGAILGSTLDFEETLSSVARLCVREFADHCFVDLVGEAGEIRRLRSVSRDPFLDCACMVLAESTIDRNQPCLTRESLETRQPVLMATLHPEDVARFAQGDADRLRALQAIDPRSVMTVPLLAQARVLGVLTFISSSLSRHYTTEDLHLAEQIGARAALSIENARLFQSAQRALHARDELLGIVAHDLRNPLNSIVLHSNILKRLKPDQRASLRSSARAITRSATRMGRMIEDLLDISRVEAGQLTIDRTRVPVHQLLVDAAETQTPLSTAHSVELRLELPEELPDVWADRDRLLQVFENLIGNALKFTPRAGRITIGAGAGDDDVRFCVADTGTGIAREHLPHIFDRFWQAQRAGRRGAGLGLAIVKGIVEAHGGRIWVESAPGCGTKVFFAIPIASTGLEASTPASEA